uniref:Uncharacterized protein n=1 Tax=Ditylenchus dipsaci TaxID=166011 RepID=A0A915E4F4_9BILA
MIMRWKKAMGSHSCNVQENIESQETTNANTGAGPDRGSGATIFSSLIEQASDKVKAEMIQKNVSDMVYYHRKLLNNDPNTPCDPENLEIPPDLLNYKGRLSLMETNGSFTEQCQETFNYMIANGVPVADPVSVANPPGSNGLPPPETTPMLLHCELSCWKQLFIYSSCSYCFSQDMFCLI